MSGYEGQEEAVKDLEGNWWHQDPTTASWYIWNGQAWKLIPGAAPRIAPQPTVPKPESTKQKSNVLGSCLLTASTGVLIALIVIGGIAMVAYNFFPDYYITPEKGDINQILKLGGGGLFLAIFGLFMLNRGFRTILARGIVDQDDWGEPKDRPGCLAILNSLGQFFFGVLFLAGGLGLLTVVFFQEILPWFGL